MKVYLKKMSMRYFYVSPQICMSRFFIFSMPVLNLIASHYGP